MPRRVRLTRLEDAILKQISEAGAEDVTVVINSTLEPESSSGASAPDIGPFETALRRLCSLGLVALVWSDLPGYPRIDTNHLKELLCLSKWILWESEGRYWRRQTGAKNVGIARIE